MWNRGLFTLALSIYALASAETCFKSSDCDDKLACSIDFCELTNSRCVNLSQDSNCNTTRRSISPKKVIKAANTPQLKRAEFELIINVTSTVLRDFHPHRLLHLNFLNIDPVEELLTLRNEILDPNGTLPSNFAFHKRMFAIFKLMHDGHTMYTAPTPLKDMRAFLPFSFKPYYVAGKDRPNYVVTDIAGDFAFSNPAFSIGSRIITWDGVPIHDAVIQEGSIGYGSNDAAKLANAVNNIRARFFGISDPPKRESVIIEFKPKGGAVESITVDWLYALKITNDTLPLFMSNGPMPGPFRVAPDDGAPEWEPFPGIQESSPDEGIRDAAEFSEDILGSVEMMTPSPEPPMDVSPEPDLAEQLAQQAITTGKRVPVPVDPKFCSLFSAEIIPTESDVIGRLILSSFLFELSFGEILTELVGTLQLLPPTGLIVDLRRNRGGAIVLAKVFTEVLTDKPFQFVNYDTRATTLTASLVNANFSGPAKRFQSLFAPLQASMNTSLQTGDPYTGSAMFPTPPGRFPSVYKGPYVILAGGLTYSTGDVFVSIHKDNNLAPVVISGGNTGAGGSAMFPYKDLSSSYAEQFPALPGNVSFSTSGVRLLRSGESTGATIEYFGIEPDLRYFPTRDDQLQDDKDLFDSLEILLTT